MYTKLLLYLINDIILVSPVFVSLSDIGALKIPHLRYVNVVIIV